MRSALSATLLMAALLWTTDAVAAPITYRFSGVVDGNLNGRSFFNADFLFELTADTANVYDVAGTTYFNVASSVTFTITGVGSGTLLNVYRLFLDQTESSVGFSEVSSGLDRVDALNNPALATYDLTTNKSLIYGDPFVGQFMNDPTTAGPLNLFNSGETVAFEATLDPRDPVVPEPASLALASIASLGLAIGAGRRRRQPAA